MENLNVDPRKPVTEVAEFYDLDAGEITEGYRDGRAGEPEPGDNRSRSYWHGYRNGRLDGGFCEPSPDQRLLASRFYAEAGRAKALDPARLP